tara:strand:+ start:950 stop:1255 length:306 start_codon:yes stop_codon:yes gene_type:complete
MTTTALILSILINLVFLFYSRWLIQIVKAKEDDMESLSSIINQYVGHVKSIHDMEMFYGDQTLSALIEHGKAIVSTIEEFDFLLLEEITEPSEEELKNNEQ